MRTVFNTQLHQNDPESLLTRKEVGHLLRLHPGTVKRLEHRGALKSIKLNSRVTRYLRSEVQKLIAAGTIQ